jgi:outer membrane protein assembly factor BamB
MRRSRFPLAAIPVRWVALLLIGLLAAACSQKPKAAVRVTPRPATTLAARAQAKAQSAAGAAQAAPAADWPMFDHDPQRSGVNGAETAVTPSTVGGLQRLWTTPLPEISGGSPILLSAVPMPDGTTADLLVVTTTFGTTVALNAATGAAVWQQTTSGPRIQNQRCQVCATPAADPSRQWIYAAGNDGAVHRYAAATGQEDQTAPWPVPVTLMNNYEKRSSALNVANGYLYVAMSGYNGDFGPYVGHILAIHLPDGASQVFNLLCSNQQRLLASPQVVQNPAASCSQREAGVWTRSGVVVDQSGGPTDGSLFIASGNGPFDANSGGTDYGDSVVRLSGDASTLQDSYTPSNYAALDQGDIDLGSTAPVLLPVQSQSSTPYLLVQGGKDSVLRLLDRTRLGGVGGELQAVELSSGDVFSAPLAWQDPQGPDPAGNNTWLFADTNSALFGFRLVTDGDGRTTLQQQWKLSSGGTSPILAGGVLFVANQNGIAALDPHTGNELWSSGQQSAGGNIGGVHWQSPILVNGRLYMADENGAVTAYSLGGQ